MKNKNGFTLVELLAVIVILAIIMIVAIPSVLGTMEAARKKSFINYFEKVYNIGTQKYMEDKNSGKLKRSSGYMSYIYDLKTDLGIDNTGDYNGFYLIHVYYDVNLKKTLYFQGVILWDSNYGINIWDANEHGMPTVDELIDVADFDVPDDFDKMFAVNQHEKCNTYQHDYVDIYTGKIIYTNEAHPNAWASGTCEETYE